ncbi:PAS domain-containing protein [Stygiobacter electus]|uniref:histidine kinase n=1 Tax=Stygiobacter electus TaxID=3032292 RepID=A0AAE3P0A3_9BACT|nr:PAS domain S-box protein [Stygiobacter electus]MDF1612027.1 PAS domain S-box protein [Stygiobacter electus]
MGALKKLLENKKNAALFFIFSSLIILLIAYFYFLQIRNDYLKQVQSELKAVAELKISKIAKTNYDELNDAKLIASNQIINSKIEKAISGDKNSIKKFLDAIEEIKIAHNYENIYFISINNRVLSTEKNFNGKLSRHLLEIIWQNKNNNESFSTDVYFCEVHNSFHLDYISPVKSGDNKLLGFLVFHFNQDKLLFPLTQNFHGEHKSTETILVKNEGEYVITLTPLKFKKGAQIRLKIPLSKTNSSEVEAIKGKKEFFEGVDYRNVQVISYLSPVPGTKWFMVAKIDKIEIYSKTFNDLLLILFILGVIFFALFFFLFWIYYYNLKNRYEKLYDQEKSYRESMEEYKTILYGIGDAVIITDEFGKVKNVNPVAENLTGWTEEEAKGKQIEEIFNIINEKTRKKVENPVIRVIMEGTIVGLANHTLLISKDGKEIPIADSGAPIKDEEGKIIGVVLVFRDQTKEREAKNQIEKSEQRLNRGELVSKSGNWELNLTTKTIFASEGAAVIYGVDKTELDYEVVKSVPLPEYRQMLDETLINLINKNKPYDVEFKIKTVDTNEIKDIHSVAVYDKEKNTLFGIIQDVTERKKIEEKYRLISDLVSDYVFSTIIHEDGKLEIDWVAGDFEEITGYTLEDYKAAGGWLAHLHPDSILQDQEDMKKILNNEKVITEVKTIKKDKSIIWVRVFAQPYWDNEQNRVTKIYGAVQNINDRKLSRLALEESENKFSVAFNESPYALSIQDDNNIFIDVNQAFCDLTGYSKEEIIGRTGSELNLWANPEEAKKINQIFEQTGSVKNYEFLFRKKNGEIRNGIISASVIFVNGKRADIASAIDITELKEKEQKILDQLDELKRWQNVMLDREDRVIELKKEVNELLVKLGEKKKYEEQ